QPGVTRGRAEDCPGVRRAVNTGPGGAAPFRRSAVITVPAVRAIEPYLEQRSVIAEELAKLTAVILEICRPAVLGMIAIPRRQVDAERQTVLPARARQLADDVTPAILPRAAFDGVRRDTARTEA